MGKKYEKVVQYFYIISYSYMIVKGGLRKCCDNFCKVHKKALRKANSNKKTLLPYRYSKSVFYDLFAQMLRADIFVIVVIR